MQHLSLSQTRMSAMLLKFLGTMRAATDDPQMQAHFLTLFFHVAANRHPRYSLVELSRLIGTSTASITRVVAALGRGSPGVTGLGLLATYEDPDNRSTKRVTLTAKGEALLETLEASLHPCAASWLSKTERDGKKTKTSSRGLVTLWLRSCISLRHRLDCSTKAVGRVLGRVGQALEGVKA